MAVKLGAGWGWVRRGCDSRRRFRLGSTGREVGAKPTHLPPLDVALAARDERDAIICKVNRVDSLVHTRLAAQPVVRPIP